MIVFSSNPGNQNLGSIKNSKSKWEQSKKQNLVKVWIGQKLILSILCVLAVKITPSIWPHSRYPSDLGIKVLQNREIIMRNEGKKHVICICSHSAQNNHRSHRRTSRAIEVLLPLLKVKSLVLALCLPRPELLHKPLVWSDALSGPPSSSWTFDCLIPIEWSAYIFTKLNCSVNKANLWRSW